MRTRKSLATIILGVAIMSTSAFAGMGGNCGSGKCGAGKCGGDMNKRTQKVKEDKKAMIKNGSYGASTKSKASDGEATMSGNAGEKTQMKCLLTCFQI